MRHILARVLLASALLAPVAGCYVDGPGAEYAVEDDGNGDLVEVSPGVEVLADAPEPIFFADDYYWVNRGGVWYTSTWHGGGWARAGNVPGHISGLEHREGYAHYRPTGYAPHEHVRGYENHAQYHAAHPVSGGVHVRAAVRGGHHH